MMTIIQRGFIRSHKVTIENLISNESPNHRALMDFAYAAIAFYCSVPGICRLHIAHAALPDLKCLITL